MTDKPNYNDGNWHGWNGGDCPVHPESEIEAVYLMNHDADSHMVFRNTAREKMWRHPFLFRVTKEHREPREFWVTIYDGRAWHYKSRAEDHNADLGDNASEIIHVREVIE